MPVLALGQVDLIVDLGKRRKGVTVVEIKERFEVSHLAAWRALQRLVKCDRLCKTPRKRRRGLLFEDAGRGADVYKTRPEETDGQAG